MVPAVSHLAVRDPDLRTACGAKTYDVELLTGDKERVTCLRCQGTGWFRRSMGARPVVHGPAIFFLEKAILRLNASIEASGISSRREELQLAKDSVLQTIEILRALQWVDETATEIRARKIDVEKGE